jgi:hypothetical protein
MPIAGALIEFAAATKYCRIREFGSGVAVAIEHCDKHPDASSLVDQFGYPPPAIDIHSSIFIEILKVQRMVVFTSNYPKTSRCARRNMKDLTIELDNQPGSLAQMGEVLGHAGVSVEGGGAWVVNAVGVAHFLVEDGVAARKALEAAGIRVLAVREVLSQRLDQNQPGQLGKISRKMAEAGVNIEVLYSDHAHRLILVVDDIAKGRVVSEAWMRGQQLTR